MAATVIEKLSVIISVCLSKGFAEAGEFTDNSSYAVLSGSDKAKLLLAQISN